MYNYFKIILYYIKPKERESNEVVSMLRNINQQSHAFTREFQSNMLATRKELEEIVPGMKINPFKNVGMKPDEPLIMNKVKKLDGVNFLEHSIMERRRIVNKKRDTYNKDNDFYN